MRAHAFVLRLWETERLQGEASRNAAHVRTRTDSQKKKKEAGGEGRGGGAEAHRSEYKSARPKGIFASRAIRCASFQGNRERAAGSWQTILVQPHSHFSPRLFRSLFLDSVAIRECRMPAAADPFFADVLVFVYRGPGVHPSASARKRDPSIPREMCFLVAEAGTRLVAG